MVLLNLDLKKLVFSGIAGRIVNYIASLAIGFAIIAVIPYDILSLEGMRSVNDLVLLLFLPYQFALSFVMAFTFQWFSSSLKGNWKEKRIQFGVISWDLAGIPND